MMQPQFVLQRKCPSVYFFKSGSLFIFSLLWLGRKIEGRLKLFPNGSRSSTGLNSTMNGALKIACNAFAASDSSVHRTVIPWHCSDHTCSKLHSFLLDRTSSSIACLAWGCLLLKWHYSSVKFLHLSECTYEANSASSLWSSFEISRRDCSSDHTPSTVATATACLITRHVPWFDQHKSKNTVAIKAFEKCLTHEAGEVL